MKKETKGERPMNKMKLAVMVGVAAQVGLSAGSAYAEGWTASTLKVYAADPLDVARTQNGRLRKTRYEESQEMAVAKMVDAENGVFLQMQSGAIGTTQPVHRQQVACTPFKLVKQADGSVGGMVTGTAKFVTDNVGQDYRNGNHIEEYVINGGKNVLLTFNYRPQGTNNTNRYAKVLDTQCNIVPVQNSAGTTQKQVVIMQKNNDDCDMHQSGEGAGTVVSDAAGSTHIVYWAGCNGNGQDDGWVNDIQVTSVNAGAAFKIAKNFDLSVEPQEERSRGRCDISDSDPNTAICSWTAGNNQPQREGTWIGAINIGPTGPTGQNAQSRLLWKKKIQSDTIVSGVRTYSVRANSSRVVTADAAGKLTKTDQIIVQTSCLRGNNTNDRKGGRYLAMYMGVATATKAGLTWDIPLTDITNQMLGIDATHLTEAFALVQDGAKTLPAMTFMQGSQNGGGAAPADLKILAVDAASKKFIDYGSQKTGGSYDRHLYSNYLGGNPGNQGRNFAGATFIHNPFATVAADPQFLLLHALTGKDPADVMKPEIKGSSYVSIVPMFQPQALPPPPPPGNANTGNVGQNGSGGGQNAEPQAGDPTPANELPGTPATPGSFSSGCSMASNASSSASGIFFLLVGVGLVTLARRRRA
jgi:MYXO-CTERM domain-containing protein